MDYASLFAAAGIRFGPATPADQATLGPAPLDFTEEGAVIRGATLVDTPLYDAGLDRGDVIVSIGGRTPTSAQELEHALEGRKPGEAVPLRWMSRGMERSGTLKLTPDEELAGSLDPGASAEQRRFRAAWKEGVR